MNIKNNLLLSLIIVSFIAAHECCFSANNSFPILLGQIGPVADDGTSRPQQFPFICQTASAGLGEPLDNNCNAPMQVTYYYKPKSQKKLLPLPKDKNGNYFYPADMDYFPSYYLPNFISKGGNYIVRVERGVINRFIYMIAVLEDIVAHKSSKDSGYQNKVLYYFDGGSNVGNIQASNSSLDFIKDPSRLIKDVDALGLGYAILYSTGTATSTHYNLTLGLKTAQMVKKQFTSEFGEPDFTLGLGGSGGAIQQLIYSQQDPSLLNGLILLFAFPDLASQINYAADCPLLEYYFDKLAYDAPTPWGIRGFIEGLHASDNMPANKTALSNPTVTSIRHSNLGSDTCANGWIGAVYNLINPFSKGAGIKASLWDNESVLWQYGSYPIDQDGIAYNILDNEGIQYGLQALRLGKIDKKRFFDINKKIGGWKESSQFIPEDNYPASGVKGEYDGWSSQNATASTISLGLPYTIPAPRKSAPITAINAAIQSHSIFKGDVNLPILEIRIDKDDRGDIHNSFESLVIRARLKKFKREGQHILWLIQGKDFIEDTHSYNYWDSIAKMADYLMSAQYRSIALQNNIVFPYFEPTNWPILIMQNWINNIKAHPTKSIADNKPFYLTDGCFLRNSRVPHFSNTAWDGLLDSSKEKGFCGKQVVFYPTPRVVAGEDMASTQLKCPLIPVEEFIKQKGYGKIEMNSSDILLLKEIFPTGVCSQ